MTDSALFFLAQIYANPLRALWNSTAMWGMVFNAAGNVLKALHQKRVGYYQEIAVGDNARFLGGWENRANGLYERLA